jgi:hypothetical protein
MDPTVPVFLLADRHRVPLSGQGSVGATRTPGFPSRATNAVPIPCPEEASHTSRGANPGNPPGNADVSSAALERPVAS